MLAMGRSSELETATWRNVPLMKISTNDYARWNLSFPNVNESRDLLRCVSNYCIEVTPRLGMNHNDPRARKRLILRPIVVDKLDPLLVTESPQSGES